jgi:hypothetical protein
VVLWDSASTAPWPEEVMNAAFGTVNDVSKQLPNVEWVPAGRGRCMRGLIAAIISTLLLITVPGEAQAAHPVLVRYDIYTSLTSSDDHGSASYYADGRWHHVYILDGFEAVAGHIRGGETARVHVFSVFPGCAVTIGTQRTYGGSSCSMPYPSH